jgi:hypothetical protein
MQMKHGKRAAIRDRHTLQIERGIINSDISIAALRCFMCATALRNNKHFINGESSWQCRFAEMPFRRKVLITSAAGMALSGCRPLRRTSRTILNGDIMKVISPIAVIRRSTRSLRETSTI